VRRERAAARGHAAVDERSSRQLTQDEKAARATHVVRNSGAVEELEQTLSELLARIRSEHG
jgi:dephospho-CoA kinase